MRRFQQVLPGLLIALAGLLAGVLLTWFTAVLPGQREHRNNLAYAQAGALVSRLDASIIAVSSEVNALARSPAVLALVQSPDPKKLLGAFAHLDGLVAAQLLKPGQAASSPPMSEPVLDMIRRAERGVPPALEAYPEAGQQRVFSVTALRESADAPVQAILVLTFALSRFTDPLQRDAGTIGQMRLTQLVFNDPPVELFNHGHSQAPALHQLGTANATWALGFQPGPLIENASAYRFNPWLLLAAFLALSGLAGGLCLTARRSRNGAVNIS
ncbi:hypothetical protein LOY54_26835 [Pseudomonas sp. B21-032]|uniref:hypothetical protein n=1 Tax=Pseudomonas sp. B21-032 TaxID=2895483 RepID=UPI00215DE169|nr:hypothetical protein [Pseudomonas sp. B21-032]UVL61572.1 hypothetical protein LOY54_26835 [Pseudomonas sp. B21-032]